MTDDTDGQPVGLPASKNSYSAFKLFLIIFSALVLALFVAAWLIKSFIFPSALSPIELDQQEQVELNQKLQQLGYSDSLVLQVNQELEPQAFSTENLQTEFSFSEREVNALISKNTNLAEKMAIDFSDNLASARMVFPIDNDFPIIGGKTLRMNAGVSISYDNGRPAIILEGVSVWGVAVPNSWLGNLKNVDLLEEFGGDAGFWKSFSEGLESIKVEDGQLHVRLKD